MIAFEVENCTNSSITFESIKDKESFFPTILLNSVGIMKSMLGWLFSLKSFLNWIYSGNVNISLGLDCSMINIMLTLLLCSHCPYKAFLGLFLKLDWWGIIRLFLILHLEALNQYPTKAAVPANQIVISIASMKSFKYTWGISVLIWNLSLLLNGATVMCSLSTILGFFLFFFLFFFGKGFKLWR